MTQHNDYYEILNISHDAPSVDIVKAYRETKLVFQPESLATYSLYSDEELQTILAQIDEAYMVLSDPEKRREYDNQMSPNLAKVTIKPAHKSILTLTNTKAESSDEGEDNKELSSTHIDGARLKEIRESQDITLDAIASLTKISIHYLQAIEAEDAENFPEPTYLKSFLKQYASAIGLDAELVLKAYDLDGDHHS